MLVLQIETWQWVFNWNKGFVGKKRDHSCGKPVRAIKITMILGIQSAYNTWTKKADFDGVARIQAVGFSIGDKGYIGTGGRVGYEKDFWEYNPNK